MDFQSTPYTAIMSAPAVFPIVWQAGLMKKTPLYESVCAQNARWLDTVMLSAKQPTGMQNIRMNVPFCGESTRMSYWPKIFCRISVIQVRVVVKPEFPRHT